MKTSRKSSRNAPKNFLESGESEEDANEAALEAIMVEYAEFEEYLPEWTFHREKTEKRL